MARKRKTAQNDKREKAKWGGYVNFNPSPEEREAIRASLLTADRVVAFMSRLADDGYRVSHKFDHYRDTLTFEVYGQWADMENAGRTLVTAHDDLLVAASACAFFIEKIAEKGPWPKQQELNNPYSW